MLAHRIVFGLETNEEPEAVCHHCDNPPCCNPRHLFAATRAVNNADMVAKGRLVNPNVGVDHPGSKLDDATVLDIRKRYAAGGISQKALSKQFGVCQRTICNVVNRLHWRHVA